MLTNVTCLKVQTHENNPNENYKTILGGFLSQYHFEIQIITLSLLSLILNVL